jgi:hypothetical protein
MLHTQPQMCYNALTQGHEEECINIRLLVIKNFQFKFTVWMMCFVHLVVGGPWPRSFLNENGYASLRARTRLALTACWLCLAGEPELCWLCWLCCKFSAHQASVTLAGSVPSGIDWKTSAAMRWSIDPSMHLLVARMQCYHHMWWGWGQKVPSGGGDIVAEGFARSQCWWPEFGDLRELIEGQELQRFEFKISRGGWGNWVNWKN